MLSGTCDLQFTLWDAGTGGAQAGVTQTKTALSISDGGFTVVLEFGTAPFAGAARWLAVSERRPEHESFQALKSYCKRIDGP